MDGARNFEDELLQMAAYLRGELGYQAETPGSLRRQVQENARMISLIDDTLRGRGDELGLVGWMMVLRRTWITMVALLGTALGYLLNDVVDAVDRGATVRANVSAADHR